MPDRDSGRARPRPDRQPPGPARVQERDAFLDRVRDYDRIQQLAGRLHALEQEHPDWAHTFREHVSVTDAQLVTRAATGVNARGLRELRPPEHATRWQSQDAMVLAADRLRRSAEFRDRQAYAERTGQVRIRTDHPLAAVLGPGWRSDVYGRSRESAGAAPSRWRPDSQAVAIWQKQEDGRWHLYTCYPEVGR